MRGCPAVGCDGIEKAKANDCDIRFTFADVPFDGGFFGNLLTKQFAYIDSGSDGPSSLDLTDAPASVPLGIV